MAIRVICQECGSELSQNEGFRSWCPSCEWNLGDESERPLEIIAGVYAKYGERFGLRLFEDLVKGPAEAMKPSIGTSKVSAALLASLVHFLTAAFFIFGVWCIYIDWLNWPLLILGGVFIVGAYALAPSLGKAPNNQLSRIDAPEIFALVDEISNALGTETVDAICLSPEINASYNRVGLKRTSVLTLGTPLWLSLDAKQKIALVAHEMAHQVNGDVARSFWVGEAINALQGWYGFLRQPYENVRQTHEEGGALVELLVHYGCLVLSWPVRFFITALIHLYWNDSQRAEYLADYLGSRVSGTQEFISLNERMSVVGQNHQKLDHAMRKHSRDPVKIIPAFALEFQDVPNEEIERVRRVNKREHLVMDSTHPPTVFRSDLLKAFPCAATVVRSPKESEQMNGEVSAWHLALGKELVRAHLETL